MISQAKEQLSRLLPKSEFSRRVSVLAGGTASAQLLLILAAPLLTRLYAPDDFGLLAVYAGLVSIIGVIASLRYELAIPLPESDKDAAHVVVLSLLIAAAITIFCGLIVLFFGEVIADHLGVPRLADYFWLLPVGVLLTGTYQVFNYWAIRSTCFSTIAGTKLRQALAAVAIQLLGFKAGGLVLLLGHAGGQVVGTVGLGVNALVRPEFLLISWKGIKCAVTRYRQFPIYSTWAALINAAGRELPAITFAAFFSPVIAGLYALSNRVVNVPLALIGRAVGDVYLSGAAGAYREGRLGAEVERLHGKLSQLAMPPAIILMLVGPDLFGLVFGSEWRQSGVFAQWLALPLYAAFVASPLSLTFAVVEKQWLGTVMQIQLFVMRVFPMVTAAYVENVQAAVAAYAVGSFIGYLVYSAMSLKVAHAKLNVIFTSFLTSFGLALLCSLPLLVAQVWLEGLGYMIGLMGTATLFVLYYTKTLLRD